MNAKMAEQMQNGLKKGWEMQAEKELVERIEKLEDAAMKLAERIKILENKKGGKK